jgi:hypothetical protein
MLNGQTFYVGNFTLEGVRKMRNGKLHHPPYSSSSKKVLIRHSAVYFNQNFMDQNFVYFLRKYIIITYIKHI